MLEEIIKTIIFHVAAVMTERKMNTEFKTKTITNLSVYENENTRVNRAPVIRSDFVVTICGLSPCDFS